MMSKIRKPSAKTWHRLLELRRNLRWANARYYYSYTSPEFPEVEDSVFDGWFIECVKIEKRNAKWLSSWGWTSPTVEVNGHPDTLPLTVNSSLNAQRLSIEEKLEQGFYG